MTTSTLTGVPSSAVTTPSGSDEDRACPTCGETVDATLVVREVRDAGGGNCASCGEQLLGRITHVCQSCKHNFRLPSWHPLTDHPAVVSFYKEHGIDHVHNSWEAIRRCFGWRERLMSTDPVPLEISVPAEDEELHATIGETEAVVEIER